MDTLVLGCTHYVFAKDALRSLLGPDVHLVDTSAAVARQTRRLLKARHALREEPATAGPTAIAGPAQVRLLTTGKLAALQAAAARWLDVPAHCCEAVVVGSEMAQL